MPKGSKERDSVTSLGQKWQHMGFKSLVVVVVKEVEVVQLEVKALDSEQVEVLHIIGDDNDDDDFDIFDHFRYVLWHGLD